MYTFTDIQALQMQAEEQRMAEEAAACCGVFCMCALTLCIYTYIHDS